MGFLSPSTPEIAPTPALPPSATPATYANPAVAATVANQRNKAAAAAAAAANMVDLNGNVINNPKDTAKNNLLGAS